MIQRSMSHAAPPMWLSQALGGQAGFFVTGTDTGVGKTFFSCLLIQYLRAMGVAVVPRKPVESGCHTPARGSVDSWAEGDDLEGPGSLSDRIAEDAQALGVAAGLEGQALQDVCRIRLREPLAPDLAAKLEGRTLPLNDLVTGAQVPAGSFRITEGAGGFYSPICVDGLNADLAVALGDPVILVVDDRLGGINQALLNIEAILRRELRLAGIVLNRIQAECHPSLDNASAISGRTDIPILRIARCESPSPDLSHRFSTWISSMVSPPDP